MKVSPKDEGVAKGQDWDAMRAAIERRILETAISLPDGRHDVHAVDIPFAFEVIKAKGRTSGVFFSRTSPHDASIAERLREQMVRKAAKLGQYRSLGKRTVLLIESDDVALANRGKLSEALLGALPNGLPEEIDELWYVDSCVPEAPEFFDVTGIFALGDYEPTL
jgi:hypothetical protein